MKVMLIAGAVIASSTAFAADSAPLGLQLWSLRAPLAANLSSGMSEVKALGFKVVEGAGTYGHSPKEFRALAKANGLKIVSAHFPYERLQSDVDGVIAEATALGVSYVVVPWIPHKGDFGMAQARAAVADFNAWGAKFKAAGLSFGFHPHGYEFHREADGDTPFDYIMQKSDPSLVFCEMDVFWVERGGGDPVALLRKYPGRYKALHVKDLKKGSETGTRDGKALASDNVAVGTGMIDFPGIVAAAPAAGVKYYFIEDETSDPEANIPPSITYLESIGLKP